MATSSEELKINHPRLDEPRRQPAEQPIVEGTELRKKHRFKRMLLSLIGLVMIAGLLVAAVLPRIERQKKITAAAQAIQDASPAVNVITAQQAPASSELELPGNIEAIQVAAVSAQTSGYLKRWYVDIGDRVHAGQLLAEIDTPEVDQELQQARSTLVQAQASLGQAEANLRLSITNMDFARVSYERWKYLAEQHVVSDQDRDQTQAAYNAAKATVDATQASINVAKATIAANEANVRRFINLQGFKKVFAPFAGIITARNVEVGSLINAGGGTSASVTTGTTASGATTPGSGTTQTGTGAAAASGGLFQLARIDTLRIFISVPQTFVNSIKPGQTAEIAVNEFPQQPFKGTVVRTTNALDPASRTLLTEVQTTNSGYQLLPGMYATVTFGVTLAQPPVQIPATALVIRADGPQVVTVTGDQKANYQKVVIGRDYGGTLDIISGLEPGSTLILNIPDGLQDGESVRVQPAQANQPTNNQPRVPAASTGPGPKAGGS
ncbi:MAG: efflux RND transporter periplasmic adaptor subunit [Acidobacteriota bacterium]